jgi:hypothetical protein
MPAYQETKDWRRIWQADTAAALAEAMRQDLAPTVQPGDAASWSAGLLTTKAIEKPPNFDQAIKVILATFTVFTGLALTLFLAPPNKTAGLKIPPIEIDAIHGWRWWAFFALVALLLRYIIGSAIHLNYVYGGEAPRSNSVGLLFKDLMFLVLFGMLAFYIIDAGNVGHFVARAMLFVLAGFIWSIFDYLVRRFVCCRLQGNPADSTRLKRIDTGFLIAFLLLGLFIYRVATWHNVDSLLGFSALIILAGFAFCAFNLHVAPIAVPADQQSPFWGAWCYKLRHPPAKVPREWPTPFWVLWTGLDGLQFVLTGAVMLLARNEMTQIRSVAILYVGFLFFDMWVMIRHIQRG